VASRAVRAAARVELSDAYDLADKRVELLRRVIAGEVEPARKASR
jgi:hypothetical protein